MTLQELIQAARDRLDDTVPEYLWSDEALTRYANNAVDEACVRADLIVDRRTPQVCRIQLVPGVGEYDLDGRILNVQWVESRHGQVARRLEKVTSVRFERRGMYDSGVPEFYVQDIGTGRIGVNPVPSFALEIWMQVSRLPLERLRNPDDVPEIPMAHHAGLLNWILYEAYMKDGQETRSESKASICFQQFERQFGARPTSQQMVQSQGYALPDPCLTSKGI